MAAANPQPLSTFGPFRGKANENWPAFDSVLRSLIIVGNIPNADRTQFLQLHSLDQALQFLRNLPQATRDEFDAAKMGTEKSLLQPKPPRTPQNKISQLEI